MIKVNKKVSVLLAIVMVLAVLPMTASALFNPSAEAEEVYVDRWDAAGYTPTWADIKAWFPGTTATGGPGAAPVDDVDDGDDNGEENGDDNGDENGERTAENYNVEVVPLGPGIFNVEIEFAEVEGATQQTTLTLTADGKTDIVMEYNEVRDIFLAAGIQGWTQVEIKAAVVTVQ